MAWTEQLPSGKYRGGYRIPGGQKRYTVETYSHKSRALKAATVLEEETRELGWRDPRSAERTWGEWLPEWQRGRVVEASTAKRDQSRIKVHLLPKWGSTPLIDITRFEVKAWAAELTKKGLSPATVQRNIALLSASLTAAADAEVIPVNPALRLKLGLQENPSERTLTQKEQHRLFKHLPADRDRALVAVLLGTGARWGEAVGLTAKRVDLTAGTIRYRDAWDNANQELISHTKGKKRRTVPLAHWLKEIIAPIVDATPSGYLFTGSTGAPVDYSNWHKRVWAPAVAAAKINTGEKDTATIHTLRHTYATTQLEAGLSLAEIADLLGHTNISTTERYAHRRSKHNPIAATAIADPRLAPKPKRQLPRELPSNVIAFPGAG